MDGAFQRISSVIMKMIVMIWAMNEDVVRTNLFFLILALDKEN